METPIEFGTDGWRDQLDTFTSRRVRIVAQAIADYLKEEADRGGDTVAVGYDARNSSPRFADDVADVLAGNGFDVLLPDRDCPTPVTAWTVADRNLAGAVVITASHNPAEYNGLKFIPEGGAPALPDVTEAIEKRLRNPELMNHAGEIREEDLFDPYFEHVTDLVDTDLSDLTVAYDAMHGSGHGVTDDLLENAGATVDRYRCERVEDFGGTPPEPSEENLGTIIDAVREGKADIGIANDGDADRIAVVTPERGYLNENLFFAAVYDYLLETRDGPAVRTVSTTFLIDRIAQAHGHTTYETPVGFKWIAQSMAEHDALIGGEESGGFSIRGHVREKDGVLMSLLTGAMAVDRSLDDRIDTILDEHGDISQDRRSLDCPDDQKDRVLSDLADRLPETVAGTAVDRVNDADGFKILLEDGSWVLMRPSGTEPKLRIYAESDTDKRVKSLLDAGVELVEPILH